MILPLAHELVIVIKFGQLFYFRSSVCVHPCTVSAKFLSQAFYVRTLIHANCLGYSVTARLDA